MCIRDRVLPDVPLVHAAKADGVHFEIQRQEGIDIHIVWVGHGPVSYTHLLQQKGARNVLVSMAGDGALLVDENGAVHRIGCPQGQVVNLSLIHICDDFYWTAE